MSGRAGVDTALPHLKGENLCRSSFCAFSREGMTVRELVAVVVTDGVAHQGALVHG